MARIKNRKDANGLLERMTATDTLNLNPAFISRVKKEETMQQSHVAQKLREDMKRMKDDELFPDMQYVFGTRTFPGHKLIIRSRLQNFADNDLFESDKLQTVRLSCKTQEDSEKFLRNLYTSEDINRDFVMGTLGLNQHLACTENKQTEHVSESTEHGKDSDEQDEIFKSAQKSDGTGPAVSTSSNSDQHDVGITNNGPIVNGTDAESGGDRESFSEGGDISPVSTDCSAPSGVTTEQCVEGGNPSMTGANQDLGVVSSSVPYNFCDYVDDVSQTLDQGKARDVRLQPSDTPDRDSESPQPCPAGVGFDKESNGVGKTANSAAAFSDVDHIKDNKPEDESSAAQMDGEKKLDGCGEGSHLDQNGQNITTTAANQHFAESSVTAESKTEHPVENVCCSVSAVVEEGSKLTEVSKVTAGTVGDGISMENAGPESPVVVVADSGDQLKIGGGGEEGDGLPEVSYIPCSCVASGLLRCYQSQDYADCCLKVDGHRFMAHRCILAARSQYFEAMFAGVWSESEELEIELHGVTVKSLRYILLFLYGAMLEVPAADITALIQAADMFGVEGLKDWLGFVIARDFCHFFHKPCQDCVRMVPDVLILTSQFHLYSLWDRVKRWVATHFRRTWEIQNFGTVPESVLEECTKAVIDQMSIQNITQMILDAHALARGLQRNHRSEQVQLAAIRILDEALAFCAKHFPRLTRSPHFLSWSKDGAWCIDVLEESYTMVVSLLQPEKFCEVYTSLQNMLRASEMEDGAGTSYPSEEVRRLLKRLVERCEWYINRYIHHVAQSPKWSELPADLQQQLLQKCSFVPVHTASATGTQSRVAQKSAQVLKDNIVHTVTMLCETNPSLFPSLSQTRKILTNHTKKPPPRITDRHGGMGKKAEKNSNAKSQGGAIQKATPAPVSKTRGKGPFSSTSPSLPSRPGSGKSSATQSRPASSSSSSAVPGTRSANSSVAPFSSSSGGARTKTSAITAVTPGTGRPASGRAPGAAGKSPAKSSPRLEVSEKSRSASGGAVKLPDKSTQSSPSPASATSRPTASEKSRPGSGGAAKVQNKTTRSSPSLGPVTSRPASGTMTKPQEKRSLAKTASAPSRPASGRMAKPGEKRTPSQTVSAPSRPNSGLATSRKSQEESSSASEAPLRSKPPSDDSTVTELQNRNSSASSASGISRPTSGSASGFLKTARRPASSASSCQMSSRPNSAKGNLSSLKSSSKEASNSPNTSKTSETAAKNAKKSSSVEALPSAISRTTRPTAVSTKRKPPECAQTGTCSGQVKGTRAGAPPATTPSHRSKNTVKHSDNTTTTTTNKTVSSTSVRPKSTCETTVESSSSSHAESAEPALGDGAQTPPLLQTDMVGADNERELLKSSVEGGCSSDMPVQAADTGDGVFSLSVSSTVINETHFQQQDSSTAGGTVYDFKSVDNTGTKSNDDCRSVDNTGSRSNDDCRSVDDTGSRSNDDCRSVDDTGSRSNDDCRSVDDTGSRSNDDCRSVDDTGSRSNDDCRSVDDTGSRSNDDCRSVDDTGSRSNDDCRSVDDTGSRSNDDCRSVDDTGSRSNDDCRSVDDTGSRSDDDSRTDDVGTSCYNRTALVTRPADDSRSTLGKGPTDSPTADENIKVTSDAKITDDDRDESETVDDSRTLDDDDDDRLTAADEIKSTLSADDKIDESETFRESTTAADRVVYVDSVSRDTADNACNNGDESKSVESTDDSVTASTDTDRCRTAENGMTGDDNSTDDSSIDRSKPNHFCETTDDNEINGKESRINVTDSRTTDDKATADNDRTNDDSTSDDSSDDDDDDSGTTDSSELLQGKTQKTEQNNAATVKPGFKNSRRRAAESISAIGRRSTSEMTPEEFERIRRGFWV